MAAPEYVPVKPMDDVRSYESPPRRPEPWMADRPGDLMTAQPEGALFGQQGPDQGYALHLARLFRGALHLDQPHGAVTACDGERIVEHGARRAGTFVAGRAQHPHAAMARQLEPCARKR